ncbi:hypothetical protein CFP56_036265 [Quercus suber]|uniref:Uncharacterized protein n=1 Tax=Quercus suber TaxID=58331 RepID=A0AAW0J7X1_QUESU|nr:hypothetical protein CFP56_59104 [Quercus suber]
MAQYSNMKSWLLFMALIGMFTLTHVKAARPNGLNVIDQLGDPYPTPKLPTDQTPIPANPYSRGCSRITRCRGNPPLRD